jgi:3-keto-disaccharide hydrolase
MRITSGRLGAALVAAVLATLVLDAEQSQQAAPPAGARSAQAGRGRGGGGFRQPDPIDFQEHDGWVSMFDGKTLNGWSGDSNWKVEDGAITIESSCEHPTGTIYLVWQGGETQDFELKLEMKGTGNINSGIQYRGWIVPPPQRQGAGRGRGNDSPCPSGQPRGTPASADPAEAKWNMAGPQFDFDAANHYTAQFYEQSTGRGIVAWKGQAVRTEEGKNPRLIATLGEPAVIDSYFKPNEYNDLHLVAVKNHYTHILNGHVISILVDEDKSKFKASGLIALEVESTGKLFVRNIWLKRL